MTKNFNDKKIHAIWAEDKNHLIGSQQTMPWHLPAELAHFKKTTMGQAILMGRKTFDGMGRRILPGRDILILTRDSSYKVDGVQTVSNVEETLEWFERQDKDLYIAGGAHVYDAFRDYYDSLIRTSIQGSFEGDTYFPELNLDDYILVSENKYDKDAKNPYDFIVSHFIKNR